MNEFMTMMNAARRASKPSFTYKGRRYVKHRTPSGMMTYKRA